MGNNEPLPPPPPPGFNPPPQQPQYTPPPQPQQPQQYPPQQYPPQYAPQQYAPVPQAPVPPKKKTGLIVGAAAVVAAVVGGIILLGGDDDKKSTGGSDNSIQIAIGSTTTDNSLVITVPVSNGNNTDTSVGDDAATMVTDESNSFSVMVPNGMDVETSSLPINGSPIWFVTVAPDIKAYNQTHDSFGFSVLMAGSQTGFSVLDMLNALAPDPGVCFPQTEAEPVPSVFGDATVWLFEGCGTNGQFAKVIMAVPTDKGVLAVYFQGAAPTQDELEPFAQLILLTTQLT